MTADVSVVEPRSIDELAQTIATSPARSLLIEGNGTQAGIGRAPRDLEAIVRTRALTRVIDYAPADQTITVEAGLSLRAFAEVVAPNRQRLAFDASGWERMSVGGALATNASGPRRARYGTLKDLIVGVTLVRSDGTIAHGGGKVVKNVAGFDLPKLAVGSLGTLFAIAAATFRLHPTPEDVRALVIHAPDAARVRAVVELLTARQFDPAAVVAFARPDGFDALVTFEGFAAGVAQQVARLHEAMRELGLRAEEAGGERRTYELEHDAFAAAGNTRIKVTFLPSTLPATELAVLAPLRAALDDSRVILYPQSGVALVAGTARETTASALLHARALAERDGGSLVVQALPDDLRTSVDPWGNVPQGIALMRALKVRFDPNERLGCGRFVGGL